jgi:hypothetical protein
MIGHQWNEVVRFYGVNIEVDRIEKPEQEYVKPTLKLIFAPRSSTLATEIQR